MRKRLLCWLHRHPEVRCSGFPVRGDDEVVFGNCIYCGRAYLWLHYKWSSPGSYRKAYIGRLWERGA